MKVCFETFGCRLNRAEALQMEADYLAQGWEVTTKHSDANLFVVRGCSVTHRAQRDCEKLIAHLKKKYPFVKLRVCGCLKTMDATLSSRQIENMISSKRRNEGVASTGDAVSPLPTRTARAYLKCQDGCNGKCTFCIVPKFRGSSVSVPFDELVDKAKRFIDAGYHEIVLTGCNLALYASQGKCLPDLIAALAELTSGCRIRIGSLEPGACALETVEAMAEHTNICRSLHIPVQSGSNIILAAMRRPYRIQDVDDLVSRIREKFPLAGIGCDLMTGFPGETKIDFSSTKGILKRLAFTNVHIFPYSERRGTLAVGLPNAVAPDLRRLRAHELSVLARSCRAKAAKKFIGEDVDILIEDEATLTGWTGEYFACEITNARGASLKRKDLVRVHVVDAKGDQLKAIMI